MPRLWANAILKLNRSQLQKRKVRELRDMLNSDFEKNVPEFPKISNEQLQKVKHRIRVQAKRDLKKRILLYVGILVFTLFVLWLCYALLLQ